MSCLSFASYDNTNKGCCYSHFTDGEMEAYIVILLESERKNNCLPHLMGPKALSWYRWTSHFQVPYSNEKGTDEVTYRVLGKGVKRKTIRRNQSRGNN